MAKLTTAERSRISMKAWRRRKPKAICAFCGRKIWAGGVRGTDNKPYHKGCYEAKMAGLKPAQVGMNPAKEVCPWCGKEMVPTLRHYPLPKGDTWVCSICGGELRWGNPRTRDRAPRDAFRYFGAEELNPRKYVFGPTGFRPPARWFAKMAQGASASYFGKKLKDLTKAEAARIGRIVGGIWAKHSDKTRLYILRKYEPRAVGAVRNLSCPICGMSNPISVANIYLRCVQCGTPLRSVKVRRK